MRHPPPVPGYLLNAPTEDDVLRSLLEVLGEHAERTWTSACIRARVRRGPDMTAADIAKAAHHLIAHGGTVAVRARSIIVRANAYAALASKGK